MDLDRSNRYRVILKSAHGTSGSHRDTEGVSGSKLDVNGREWISPPVEETSGQIDEDRSAVLAKECEDAKVGEASAAPPAYKGSTSLLDEILANQSKILVPGKFLKINRDGTLSQQTEEFEKYLNGKSCKDTKVGGATLFRFMYSTTTALRPQSPTKSTGESKLMSRDRVDWSRMGMQIWARMRMASEEKWYWGTKR